MALSDVDPEVKVEKSKYMSISLHHSAGQTITDTWQQINATKVWRNANTREQVTNQKWVRKKIKAASLWGILDTIEIRIIRHPFWKSEYYNVILAVLHGFEVWRLTPRGNTSTYIVSETSTEESVSTECKRKRSQNVAENCIMMRFIICT